MTGSPWIHEIINDRVSGATVLIIRTLQELQRLLKEGREEEAFKALRSLRKAHQGIPSWHVILSDVEGRLKESKPLERIEELKRDVLLSGKKAAVAAAEGIAGYSSIVTLSASKVVEDVLRIASPKEIFVMESRPLLEGSAMAKRLQKEGMEVKVVVDSSPGELMREGIIEAAIVGADALFLDYLVNKVGTLPLALLCRHFGVPFLVVLQWFKVLNMSYEEFYGAGALRKPPGGFREPGEVNRGVRALNLYFDLTPSSLITKVFSGYPNFEKS